MSCPHTEVLGGQMLLSTTIKEETEEDLNSGSRQRNIPKPAIQDNCKSGGSSLDPGKCDTSNLNGPMDCKASRDRGVSHLAASAITSVTKAAAKLICQFRRTQPHGRSRHHHHCVYWGEQKAQSFCAAPQGQHLSAATSVQAATKSRSSQQQRGHHSRDGAIPNPLSASFATFSSCPKRHGSHNGNCTTPTNVLRQHGTATSGEQSRPHLVRLMDEDDASLALRALHLAAAIHHSVWADDPSLNMDERQARLGAAEAQYYKAMAAASSIRHRALHSLVHKAVRRYINPMTGAPDDVLRVILELLTGCGGTLYLYAVEISPPSSGRGGKKKDPSRDSSSGSGGDSRGNTGCGGAAAVSDSGIDCCGIDSNSSLSPDGTRGPANVRIPETGCVRVALAGPVPDELNGLCPDTPKLSGLRWWQRRWANLRRSTAGSSRTSAEDSTEGVGTGPDGTAAWCRHARMVAC